MGANEVTPRGRTRSPRREEDVGLGIVAERGGEVPLWYPKGSSPTKRSPRRESDGSDTTNDTNSTVATTYENPDAAKNKKGKKKN